MLPFISTKYFILKSVRLFALLFFIFFCLFSFFISWRVFDGLKNMSQLAFSELVSTDGFVISDCNVGYNISYRYNIGSKEFQSKPDGPCKAYIPAGKKLRVVYVKNSPEISYVGEPRPDLIFLFISSLLVSIIAAWRGSNWFCQQKLMKST